QTVLVTVCYLIACFQDSTRGEVEKHARFPWPKVATAGEYSKCSLAVSHRRFNTFTFPLSTSAPAGREPGTHALYRFFARREHLIEGMPHMKHVGSDFEVHIHAGFTGARGEVARIIE